MVDSECPSIISLQDGPFSDLHKAGVPLALCIHLTEGKRTKPSRSSLDYQTVNVWFFHHKFLLGNYESGVRQAKEEGGKKGRRPL